jgi:hypothetical protein
MGGTSQLAVIPGPPGPSVWNQHGQQVSMKAEPVGRPHRLQSRSQQDQHSFLAVNGSRQVGQRDGGPAAVVGSASTTWDIACSLSRDGCSFSVFPGEGHRFILGSRFHRSEKASKVGGGDRWNGVFFADRPHQSPAFPPLLATEVIVK